MRFVKFLLLCLGFYILYYTIRDVGIQNIRDSVGHLGWQFLPVLLVYPFVFAFDTLGWMYAFPRNIPKHIPWIDLYRIRIIGESLNAIIPFSASLGGEPVKAELLKRQHGVPVSEGLASLLIAHSTLYVSLNLFVIGGILVTFKTMPLTPVLWQSVTAFLVVLGCVAAFVTGGIQWGIFKKVHELGEFFKWWKHKSDEKKHKFIQLDSDIKKFYSENRKNFFLSIFWTFLGWFAGVIEVYFVAKMLGLPIGLGEAWLLEVLIQVLRIITFFIPSSVGVQEGGIVLIFSQLGFPAGSSLAFALIRRVRELICIAAGLTLWAFVKDKPKHSKN